MTAENPIARHYRRRRKWQGATWAPRNVSVDLEDGVWCSEHRQRHGYMSKQLGVYYEKDSNAKWKALWYCVATGNVLKEVELGGKEEA